MAKAAIFAGTKSLARYVVNGLPTSQVEAMRRTRYAAYLVLAVLGKKRLWTRAYDTWTPGGMGADFIVADWWKRSVGEEVDGRVLTVYAPIGFDRTRLQMLDVQAAQSECLGYLDSVSPGMSRHVEDVRPYRWGHPMVVPYPGFITSSREAASKPFGRVVFAHSDGQGLPAFESAAWEGLRAVRDVENLLKG